MQTFEIKTHRPGVTYNKPHFYILNKGLNSGKPSLTPFTNSFVILTNDLDQDNLFSLCWVLFQSGKYRSLLRGSVIEFVVITEVKKLITSKQQNTDLNKLAEVTQKWKKAKELETNLNNQIKLLKQYQNAVLRSI
ncbi:DUF6943 family protein [Algibacter mikhailovii]|uniref:DUF6943 family protein n=1 Tax=Algibacter mikhailovii TaxID=425498 RepID=UPI002495580F|nr:hypothetical protein [Algibacter mikhailovii]